MGPLKIRNAEGGMRGQQGLHGITKIYALLIRSKLCGTTTVEMAIVLPLLLMFILGIIEYGWMFTKAHQITNAARHGARLAVLPDSSWTKVETAVATLMTNSKMAGKYTLNAQPGTNLSAITPGNPVTVMLTVNYSNIKLTGIPLIPTPTSLGAKVTMAREGP